MEKQMQFYFPFIGRLIISVKAAELLSIAGLFLSMMRGAWAGPDQVAAKDLSKWRRSHRNRRRGLFAFRDGNGTKYYFIFDPDKSVVKILLASEF